MFYEKSKDIVNVFERGRDKEEKERRCGHISREREGREGEIVRRERCIHPNQDIQEWF